MIRYVGLDVHKRVVEACIVDQAGKVVHRERFALTARTWRRSPPRSCGPLTTWPWRPPRIAGPWPTCCGRTLPASWSPIPMATKAIAQAKVKTDKVDAHVLAQLLRCDFLPEVWQPDEATRRLRELTGRRSALVSQRTMMRNRIHSVLAMRLVAAPSRLFKTEGLEWLATVGTRRPGSPAGGQRPAAVGVPPEGDRRAGRRVGAAGSCQRSRETADDAAGRGRDHGRSVLAAWGDATRFPDGDHAASYLGLVPSTKQSANQCYHGPITKRGNSQARWMLIEAAQHLDKHPGPLGHFFRRLCRKKNRNVAVVAAARKLAWIGWRMLVTGEPYRYADPRTATETSLRGSRVKATGVRRKSGPGQGPEARGEAARRKPHDQSPRGGLPVGGPAPAVAAAAWRAANGQTGWL